MPLFTRHPIHQQTAYSDLKQRASEQQSILVGTSGSVNEREVNNRQFYYRQFYDAAGKKRADYLGPVGQPRGDTRAAEARASIAVANSLVRDARELVRVGYCRTDTPAAAVLAAAANHALFRAGAVVVGLHAYGALLNELGVRAAPYSTADLDIARSRRLDLPPGESLADILAESNVPLLPVPSHERGCPSTSYKTHAGDFRVDLLMPTGGSNVRTMAVPELAAHAIALPFLSYLLVEPVEAVALSRESVIPIVVPRPEVFVWHKVLVSQLRGATRDKRRKDLHQAAVLFAVVAVDAPHAVEYAYRAMPHGARAKTREGVAALRPLLEGDARSTEVLDGILG